MRFAFIQAHARIFRVTTMCRVLEVSKAGYYAWRARPLCARVKDDHVLYGKVKAIHERTRCRYGSPRIHRELRTTGTHCGRKRVARLMRDHALRATPKRAFRVTTNAQHDAAVAPNYLQRQFAGGGIAATNRVWAADITYIPTGEGWLYLAVILDLKSRRVVGWSVRARLDQALTLRALEMALLHRGARSVLHHSDRGVQYASHAYQRLLASAGCTSSMSRKGDCWDNAVVESFFATVTKELLALEDFSSRATASRALFEFIEIWYNRQRLHSALNYQTPAAFEEQLTAA